MFKEFLANKSIRKYSIILGSIIFLSIIISVYLCFQNPKLLNQVVTASSYGLPRSGNNQDSQAIGEIFGDKVVEQTFLSTKENITSISVGFVAYERFNDSHITVELWDDAKECMYDAWTISAHDLTSYYNKTFTLGEKIENTKDKIYRVVIYSKDATVGNGISLHKMTRDIYEDGVCYISGEKVDGNIRLFIGYELEQPISYSMQKNAFSLFLRICIYLSFIFLFINQIIKMIIDRKKIIKKLKELWTIVNKSKKLLCVCLCVALVVSIFVAICLPILSYEEGKVNFHIFGFIWCLLMGFLVYFVMMCKKTNYIKTEVIFVVIAMFFGCLFVFGEPVSTSLSWDDEIHYREVVKLSYLSESYIRKADAYMINRAKVNEYQIGKIEDTQKMLNASYYGIENVVSQSTQYYTTIYNKLGYLPAAFAYGVGRSIKLPYTWIFCFGKLANLILYTSLVYIGIKHMNYGKTILAAIALFPTNIFQASNYTYDYWVNALTMLGIALIFSLLQEYRKEEGKNTVLALEVKNKRMQKMVGILVILFLGIGPKAIYFPLLSLILILPNKSKKIKRKHWAILVVLLAVVFVAVYSFMGTFLKSGFGSGDWRGGYDVNPALQVKFILENPIEYTKILLKYLFGTYLRFSNSASYTNRLGFLEISFFGGISMALLLVAMLFDRGNNKEWTWKMRVFVGCVVFGTLSLVATAMYISYNPVGNSTINGCQARYFLPLIFPLAYMISNQRISNYLNQKIETEKWYYAFFFLKIVVLFGTQFTLLVMRYY
ncbi:MAG: DUF2142 domain-containing protein [Lachnospiraceae bacterium]|nr:DUF2142 domain-containing protein [Lachnospiraceae bacterium]